VHDQQSVEKVRELFTHLRLALSLTEELIYSALASERNSEKLPAKSKHSAPFPDITLPDRKMFLTIKDIRDVTGLGRSTIFKSISEGRLRKIKYGNKTLVRVEEFQAWIDSWKVD
jgi:excisionase family DNA binding protein